MAAAYAALPMAVPSHKPSMLVGLSLVMAQPKEFESEGTHVQ